MQDLGEVVSRAGRGSENLLLGGPGCGFHPGQPGGSGPSSGPTQACRGLWLSRGLGTQAPRLLHVSAGHQSPLPSQSWSFMAHALWTSRVIALVY